MARTIDVIYFDCVLITKNEGESKLTSDEIMDGPGRICKLTDELCPNNRGIVKNGPIPECKIRDEFHNAWLKEKGFVKNEKAEQFKNKKVLIVDEPIPKKKKVLIVDEPIPKKKKKKILIM